MYCTSTRVVCQHFA